MSLPELGIKRYVMAFMVASAIMMFGIVGFFMTGIDQYPDVDFPFITVVTTQQGADAEVVDQTITNILLQKLNGISGIDYMTGTSSPGVSTVAIAFVLEKNVDIAFNEVQAKISEAISSLPSDIDSPIVRKENISGSPIIRLTLTGNRTLEQLNAYAEDYIQKRLETVNGVSEIPIYGTRDRELRVELDVYKMASFGLAVGDVSSAITKNHFQLPGGYIVSNKNELLLNLDLEYHSADDMKKLVIKKSGSSLVRLEDIANVYEGLEDFRTYASFNANPSLIIGVKKISGSNAFAIEKEIMERLNTDIMPSLEPGLSLKVTSNDVDFIRALVAGLEEHLYLGTLLTAVIVYLFLRSFISTIIVSLAIPISLLGAIFVMYSFGYTLNTITLLGLLLLIGVVVDDAIIILENIYRKMEEGIESAKAAIEGSNQIMFAVLASTLSLVSIFGPVMFMGGIIGKFFKSFAVIVVFGVLISYVVSLYITPMLCARYLKVSHKKEGRFKRMLENSFLFIERQYFAFLSFSLSHRALILLGGFAFFMSSFLFFSKVPGEFASETDKAAFRVMLKTTSGSNIYYTIEKIREVEAILKKYPEITDISATISSTVQKSTIYVSMLPISERKISQKDFIKKIQPDFNKIVGASVIGASDTVGGGDYGIEFKVTGPNLRKLYQYSDDLKQELLADPSINAVNSSTDLLPQIRFIPNRDKISLMGLTSTDVVNAIAISIGGLEIAKYNNIVDSNRYDLRLKGKDSQFTWKDSINNIYLKAGDKLLRLDNVVQPEEFLGFTSVERYGTMFSASFGVSPTVLMSDAMIVINSTAKKILPPGYNIEYTGGSKEFQKTIVNVSMVFLMAIILLYMVLASQFNSFIQPLILMVSVPLAVVGGVFALYITGFSLNMFSMIGLILLVGLVAKNAILLIDFTNELRKEGFSISESLLKACPTRLRPILMTSLTVIFTMIPAAIAKTEGSEDNASLAITVIGGMISSTLLTLIIVPTAYAVVETIFEKRKNKKNKNQEPLKIIQG